MRVTKLKHTKKESQIYRQHRIKYDNRIERSYKLYERMRIQERHRTENDAKKRHSIKVPDNPVQFRYGGQLFNQQGDSPQPNTRLRDQKKQNHPITPPLAIKTKKNFGKKKKQTHQKEAITQPQQSIPPATSPNEIKYPLLHRLFSILARYFQV
eukprot:TRINITY_DN1090_c0_g1_i7.p5 TRINITY_DN1090_c0_g1~~TRINITY_DN1090_c0_g1_i7.p5  ORF type:complete len:154 (+),score=4.79 TRINITY_DN1090_c0_g1_i7:1166-1627(+)